ncbi:hypothetical protein Pint_06219 [Pistacia integerrima]|uniref:Uncharacterized protein n=1 Tax=Pistacia integerrima TaxID=434235 RepID=A0ACC0Z0T2_9ROSI|nr:hypothetical protein Pint_06219 [Pistacia integerrima]
MATPVKSKLFVDTRAEKVIFAEAGKSAMATTVKLKLFVDTRAEKVIFAEAGKDFIDFLVYFLSLPVGTVARLLKGKGTVGSLSNLYKSVENLSESFFKPNQTKNSLLNPRAPRSAATGVPLLLCDYDSHTRMVYSCPSHYHNITDVPNLLCPSCNKKMTGPLYYVPPSLENTGLVEEGFVKSFVSFMVTDDLEFMPISPENLFSLLNKSNVEEIDALEKMDVELGADEVSPSLFPFCNWSKAAEVIIGMRKSLNKFVSGHSTRSTAPQRDFNGAGSIAAFVSQQKGFNGAASTAAFVSQ